MAQRNVPNPVEQTSPIDLQDRGISISTGDPDNTYTLDRRRRVHINVSSGEIEVKFFDSDSVEVTPSLIVDEDGAPWEYNFTLKQSAPSELRIGANVDNSLYDIRIEKV